jgi:hypothetical protein
MFNGKDDDRFAIFGRFEYQPVVTDNNFVVFQIGEFGQTFANHWEVFERIGGIGYNFDTRSVVEARDIIFEHILQVEISFLSPNY